VVSSRGVTGDVALGAVPAGNGVCCGKVPVPVAVGPDVPSGLVPVTVGVAVPSGLVVPVAGGLTLGVGETVLDGDVEYVGVGDGGGCVDDFWLCLC